MAGVCGSPISSTDEAEPETTPAAMPAAAKSLKHRASLKIRTRTPQSAHLLPRRLSGGDKKATPVQRQPTRQGIADRIRGSPLRFVKYLSQQLEETHQSRLSGSYGFGHGYMLELPPLSLWKPHQPQARESFKQLVQALGFTSRATLGPNVYRIAGQQVDVILDELKLRLRSAALEQENEEELEDAVMETAETPDVAMEHKQELQSLQNMLRAVDSQKLEVLSSSEHKKMLLSSQRHMEIADAMEEMLAQPSRRKDRSRARRLSRLGRIAERRLSNISNVSVIHASGQSLLDISWYSDDMDVDDGFPAKPRVRTRAASKLAAAIIPDKVLQIVLHSGFLSADSLKSVARNVSSVWRKLANIAYACEMTDYLKQTKIQDMALLYASHPRGHYLSDGAYKEVFKVYSSRHKRLEAVSVMDMALIEGAGNKAILRQEVIHSVLLSDLVQSQFCPNFLAIFAIYLAPERPQATLWGDAENRKPVELLADNEAMAVEPAAAKERKPIESGVSFQYIHMELCDGGDLEHFISLQDDKSLPLESVVIPFFFQMVFSLYCARERYQLRHCDIKLLNFFLKDIDRNPLHNRKQGQDLTVRYMLEDCCFDLRLPAAFSYWVKLGDYGSADSNIDSLGQPVTPDQFTTLENSPIEFLLEGDAGVQSYAADTFSLGLCLVHLLTGSGPYEEVLDEVRCPDLLYEDLKYVWMSPKRNSGYSVIKRVTKDDQDRILYNSLYRYLVLFGLPDTNPSMEKRVDKVWNVLLKHLRPSDVSVGSTRSLRRAQHQGSPVLDRYKADQRLFSIDSGVSPLIKRGRERLQSIPGARDLLMSLVAFNPAHRPSLKRVLLHPIFSSLSISRDELNSQSADYTVRSYANANVATSFADV